MENASRSKFGWMNNNWRGGRTLASNGYVLIRVGLGHHLADVRGYAYEHRIVAEEKIGRRLIDDEVVHHRDGNKRNNHPSNLEVVADTAHHLALHRKPWSRRRPPGSDNPNVSCACGCGEVFPKYDDGGRPRKYVTGHNANPSKVEPEFLGVMGETECKVSHLADALGRTGSYVNNVLSSMARKGMVKRLRRGVWIAVCKAGFCPDGDQWADFFSLWMVANPERCEETRRSMFGKCSAMPEDLCVQEFPT